MEKLAKDIVDSTISGKMKQSVLKHYRDFVYHSYVYKCYLDIPSPEPYRKEKLTVLNKRLANTLTLDMVFKLYVEGMACMNYLLPSIHWQLFNYRNEPTGLKECFMDLHDTILLRHHIQNYMVKLGHYPLTANITISKYGRYYNDPYREKVTQSNLIINSSSKREQYERAINSICLVNNPEYTRTKCRSMYKIHRIKVYKNTDYNIYPTEFWNMYIECCKHWGVQSNLHLIKI